MKKIIYFLFLAIIIGSAIFLMIYKKDFLNKNIKKFTSVVKTKTITNFKKDTEPPNVTIVTTGGTIAEKTDPKTGGAVPDVGPVRDL